MEHTKTPWKYSGQNAAEIYGYRGFYEDRPQTVATIKGYWDGEAQANAAFIIRACNSHDELLEACKQAWNYVHACKRPGDFSRDDMSCTLNIVESALAAAIAKAEAAAPDWGKVRP